MNEEKIGYGAVWGASKREDRDAIFEFYLLPECRKFASFIFEELISASGATLIECQTRKSAAMITNTKNTGQMTVGIRTSMYIAFSGGIVTPVLETIRRWHQLSDPKYFISWFDDYLIGAFLLLAAWRTLQRYSNGYKLLIAAWGFATGMIFCSFFGQLQQFSQPDPSQISPVIVMSVKGIMFAVCILSFILAIQHTPKTNTDHTMIL